MKVSKLVKDEQQSKAYKMKAEENRKRYKILDQEIKIKSYDEIAEPFERLSILEKDELLRDKYKKLAEEYGKKIRMNETD